MAKLFSSSCFVFYDLHLGIYLYQFVWRIYLTFAWSRKPPPPLLSPLPAQRVSKQRNEAKRPLLHSWQLFTAFSPEVASCPSPHLSTQHLTILGKKHSLYQTCQHTSLTVYKISLIWSGCMTSLTAELNEPI